MELFKPIYINGERTIYAISTNGRVINTKRNKFIKANPKGKYKTKSLEPIGENNLYMEYALHHKGKYYYKLAHRLVAEYFIPIPEKYINEGLTMDDLEVDHIDDVRYHNNVENLQWVTGKENIEKLGKSGRARYASGSLHGMCKLTDEQLDMVGKLLSENVLTQTEISEITGVPYNTILEIRAKRRFRYLSEKYDFSNYNRFSKNSHKEKNVRLALTCMESGEFSIKEISEITGISYKVLDLISRGEIWKTVFDEYNLTKFYNRKDNSPI